MSAAAHVWASTILFNRPAYNVSTPVKCHIRECGRRPGYAGLDEQRSVVLTCCTSGKASLRPHSGRAPPSEYSRRAMQTAHHPAHTSGATCSRPSMHTGSDSPPSLHVDGKHVQRSPTLYENRANCRVTDDLKSLTTRLTTVHVACMLMANTSAARHSMKTELIAE
jgi:hypothetical protein